jgi:hypothetical protein
MPWCARDRRWLQTNRLELLNEQPPLCGRLCLRRLRHQLARVKTMQDSHGIQT